MSNKAWKLADEPWQPGIHPLTGCSSASTDSSSYYSGCIRGASVGVSLPVPTKRSRSQCPLPQMTTQNSFKYIFFRGCSCVSCLWGLQEDSLRRTCHQAKMKSPSRELWCDKVERKRTGNSGAYEQNVPCVTALFNIVMTIWLQMRISTIQLLCLTYARPAVAL